MGNSSLSLAPRIKGSGQVVQTAFANFTSSATVGSASTTAFVDTGIKVSITPTNAASTIAGKVMISAGSDTGHVMYIVKRDSTTLITNDSSASVVATYATTRQALGVTLSFPFTDNAHNSITSITYTIYACPNNASAENIYINREVADLDAITVARYASSIFVKERI